MKILSVLLIICQLLGCDQGEGTIIIVPKGYIGYVMIVFDQVHGADPIYEDGKRVYKVPESGILKTKFSPNSGWTEFPEFYYGKISDKNKIPFKFDPKTLPADSIVAFGGTAGSINKDSKGKEVIKLLMYHIGNKAQIDSTYELIQKLDIIRLTQ